MYNLIKRDVMSDMIADFESQVQELWRSIDTSCNCGCTVPNPVTVGLSAYPRLDILNNEKEYIIKASVPGFELNELEIEINLQAEGPVLTISGKKTAEVNYDKKNLVMHEIKQSQFTRSLLLPEGEYSVEAASLQNGILTIMIPKPKSAQKPKKIKIDIK